MYIFFFWPVFETLSETLVKRHGPYSDSGYGSMLFPVAPGTENGADLASIHDNQKSKQSTEPTVDQDVNQKSGNVHILDVGSSKVDDNDETFSQIPTQKSHQEHLAEKHITALLAQNEDLRPL